MRLGVVSAILGSMDFFEAVDCVSSLGYTCMAVSYTHLALPTIEP